MVNPPPAPEWECWLNAENANVIKEFMIRMSWQPNKIKNRGFKSILCGVAMLTKTTEKEYWISHSYFAIHFHPSSSGHCKFLMLDGSQWRTAVHTVHITIIMGTLAILCCSLGFHNPSSQLSQDFRDHSFALFLNGRSHLWCWICTLLTVPQSARCTWSCTYSFLDHQSDNQRVLSTWKKGKGG